MPSQEDFNTIKSLADLAIKYGFLGVGLMLTLVIAPLTYKIWQIRGITLGIACFGIAFIVSFGVLDLVSKFAPEWIASNRSIIVGVVRGVQDGYLAQIHSDVSDAKRAYVKREFDKDDPRILNFPFIFLSKTVPSCFAIAISSTDRQAEGDTSIFHLTSVSKEDAVTNREIIAQVKQHQGTLALEVWREENTARTGNPLMLEPLGATEEGCGTHPSHALNSWLWVTKAFAQNADPDLDNLIIRLRSDDVFTRRNARIALSRTGPSAFPIMSELLDHKDYRVQLGAVVAFGGMPAEQRKQAPQELLDKVRALRNHPDKAMQDAAVQALR